ncbi:hypothetical protein Tco_1410682 [Tanacetum coccineum]
MLCRSLIVLQAFLARFYRSIFFSPYGHIAPNTLIRPWSREARAQSMDASHRARSEKMPPRRAPRTRTTLATATATTSMTDAAIRALIS